MNKKLILGTFAGLATVGALALSPMAADALNAGVQSRNGGKGGMNGSGLEVKAQAVDMTSDQLREQLQTKTMADVIADKGLTTEQYQEKIRAASSEHWQEMGLSQEEIQQRTQDQQERQADCDGTGANQGQGGYRNGQSR